MLNKALQQVIPVFMLAMSAVVLTFTSVIDADEPASQPVEASAERPEVTTQPVPPNRTMIFPGPQVDDTDATLLMHYARRAIRFAFRGTPWEGDRYEPPTLENMRGVVYLRLWRNGVTVVESESDETTIVSGTIAAATELGTKLKNKLPNDPSGGSKFGLQFEFLAAGELIPPPYFSDGGTWSPQLLGSMEPGFHAIGVEFLGDRAVTRASQIVESSFSPGLILVSPEARVGLGPVEKKLRGEDVKYYRYETVHFYHPTARSRPVRLLRGEKLLPLESVDAKSVAASLKRTGDYLRYRHNSNGSFSHEYVPASDTYTDANNALVQMRSLFGLARYSAHTKDLEDEQAAATSIDAFSKYLEELKFQLGASGERVDTTGGLILFFPGHEDHLETSALLLLSMATVPDHARYESQMRGLTQSLKLAGFSDGSIRLVLGEAPQGPPTASDDRAAAMTIAALAQRYALTKDAEIDTMLLGALSYFQGRSNEISSETAAWLIRGFATQYENTGQPRYEEFVFDTADRYLPLQLDASNCAYIELYGAINARLADAVGAKSALYVAALADALRVARRTGDVKRVAIYERAVRLGVRFIMQLEFVEDEAYFCRSKLDTLGGIRTAPWNVHLRVDHCAAGVDALIACQTALFR